MPPAATPATDALAALMCLHAARLPARLDSAGDLHSLVDQDRSRWDTGLLAEGLALLERSAAGAEVTAYHIEAAIAAAHASARSVEETDWASIVSLYDRLMEVAPSPVVALNRAIAIAQRDGPDRGLEELHAIGDRERLSSVPVLSRGDGRAGAPPRQPCGGADALPGRARPGEKRDGASVPGEAIAVLRRRLAPCS